MLGLAGRRRRALGGLRRLVALAVVAAAAGLLSLSAAASSAFVLGSAPRSRGRSTAATRCWAGKGFSDSSGPEKKRNKQAGKEDSTGEESTGIVKDERERKSKALTRNKLQDLRDKTLALRQKREEELNEYEEGRAMLAKYGPSAGVMPKKVAQRVAKRGMVIGGSFYGIMLAVFFFGIILFKTQEIIIPPTLMAFTTLFLLGLAIFGSSYGMMSASWDEDREGSVLGTEEFGNNVKAIGEGFRRLSMQNEYEKAIEQRSERKQLLAAKEEKKKELLNK
mmetsp:Transcript_48370/g.103693  ORF Transcript_48370/g.103693 Transcript_48370/m.103693 type:complete len:279 (+) Transcript_48370:131-967(+)